MAAVLCTGREVRALQPRSPGITCNQTAKSRTGWPGTVEPMIREQGYPGQHGSARNVESSGCVGVAASASMREELLMNADSPVPSTVGATYVEPSAPKCWSLD